MKDAVKPRTKSAIPRRGTRDVVETAIELARSSASWEVASRTTKKGWDNNEDRETEQS